MTWEVKVHFHNQTTKFFLNVRYLHLYGDVLEIHQIDGNSESIPTEDIQGYEVEVE